jgi:hypothetical protein
MSAPSDPPVIILASGYATDALWRAAIAQALHYGRHGTAVDRAGRVLSLADMLQRLEADDEGPR